MGLKRWTIQCLKGLLKQSEPPSAEEPETGPISVAPALPDTLGRDEYIARFIFRDRDLFKSGAEAGRPKPQAFKPDCFEGSWELSVCRNTGLNDARIWEISRSCRDSLRAIARADIGMSVVHDIDMMAKMARGTFPEHAVVLGWDPGGDKDAHMMKQVALASASDPYVAPSSAAPISSGG